MQSDFKKNIDTLEKIFSIKIKDEYSDIFKCALTHTSYTQENNLSYLKSYERLEFLGDAVLKLCTSELLYKKFPEYKEGDMSRIRGIAVSDDILAKIAQKLKLSEILILG